MRKVVHTFSSWEWADDEVWAKSPTMPNHEPTTAIVRMVEEGKHNKNNMYNVEVHYLKPS